MEKVNAYFFDTYALYEIVHKNASYFPYTQDVSVVTTKLNLMELYYILLREYGKEKAEETYAYFKEFCIDISDEVLKQASEFRFQHYRRDLSYIDCIGYVLAQSNSILFLTGDKQFEDFEGVEFVK